jgi:biotin carboxyl carrier protein
MDRASQAVNRELNGRVVAEVVAAEMVANVLEVLVAPGQDVAPGAALVLLESMKMEIPVLAEVGGRVSAVKVDVGDVVQTGDVLVVIE